jgi:hypothetical protein
VEGHVVLAHELDIADVVRALVGAPPAFPIVALARIHPFGGAGDVFDGRVEPDVEDLALHPRPVLSPFFTGTPQSRSRVIPRSCNPSPSSSHFFAMEVVRTGQSVLECRSSPAAVAHGRLAQVEVLGLPHLQVGGARDGGTRLDQVGGVELFGAVLALVATGAVIAAIGAGALDVAVRQEPAIGLGIDLFFRDFRNQPRRVQPPREMLRQRVVLRAGGAAEMVEAEAEAPAELILDGPHLGAILRHGFARLGRRKLRRCAVFVGGAEKQHLVAARAHVAGIEIRRKLRTDRLPRCLIPLM